MRSMYRFSIIALAVASLALFAAGTAFAEYTAGGSVTGGFGQITATPEGGSAVSNLTTQSEAVVDFAGSAGAVSSKIRLELVEGNKNVDNTRHYVRWQVNDQIGLQFNGVSYGSTAGSVPFGATVVGHLTSLAGPGHYAGYAMWAVGGVNKSNFDINFKTGGMDLGIVLSGGYDLYAADADHETQTIVPYFNGNFGGIAVHVYAASASGKDGADASIKANETSLTGIWKGSGMQFSLQYVTGKYDDAFKTTGIAFAGRVAGISFHYISDKEEPDAGGDPNMDVTDLGVAYTAAINDGATWSIGYGVLTDKVVGGSTSASISTPGVGLGVEGNTTQILFSVQGKY